MSSRAARRFLGTALGVALIFAGTTACEEQVDVRGNLPHPKVVSTIKPGVHKRTDIESMLGTPSAVATFDKEIWYYIGGRVKTISFFTPEVLERKVVTVRFDDKGIVESVTANDAPLNPNIQLVDRETPTKGKELTLIQQLIGNIGRIGNIGSNDSSGGVPGRPPF